MEWGGQGDGFVLPAAIRSCFEKQTLSVRGGTYALFSSSGSGLSSLGGNEIL